MNTDILQEIQPAPRCPQERTTPSLDDDKFQTGDIKARAQNVLLRHQMQPHSNFLFISERRKPLSRFTVCVLIRKYADAAGLGELEIHPHMLRHACGYSLANRGADTRLIQDYLGHKNITHTVRYTKLAPGRFTGLF